MNPFTIDKCVDRAVRMLKNMASPKYIDVDKQLPPALIRSCEGLAFVRIAKAGLFFLSGNVGGGVMITKIKDPNAEGGFTWSAPVCLGCGGLGGVFVFGVEAIDSIIVLNAPSAIRAFMGKTQVT